MRPLQQNEHLWHGGTVLRTELLVYSDMYNSEGKHEERARTDSCEGPQSLPGRSCWGTGDEKASTVYDVLAPSPENRDSYDYSFIQTIVLNYHWLLSRQRAAF